MIKMIYTIFEGPKVSIGDDGILTIECGPKDVGGAYDVLYENIVLIDKNGYTIPDGPFSLGNCYLEDIEKASRKPECVAAFLDDLKKMGFIGGWEVTNPNDIN